MAASRARRNGGARGRGGYVAPAPRGLSKMAYMKLEGAEKVAQSFAEYGSPRRLGLMLASAVMMTGLAVAGAVWIGGSLVDANEAFSGTIDKEAAQLGFGVSSIDVAGAQGARAEEVRKAVLPPGRESMFSADPHAARERVEQLPWVEKAQIRRVWPGTVRVQITRRQAYALWKRGQDATVVDVAGRNVANVRWNELSGLPIVTGDGAGASAAPLIAAVERTSVLNGRLSSAARVADRRWDLKLKNGAVLTLPAENPAVALNEVERLQACCQILDRPVARIDLRVPGRVVVR